MGSGGIGETGTGVATSDPPAILTVPATVRCPLEQARTSPDTAGLHFRPQATDACLIKKNGLLSLLSKGAGLTIFESGSAAIVSPWGICEGVMKRVSREIRGIFACNASRFAS